MKTTVCLAVLTLLLTACGGPASGVGGGAPGVGGGAGGGAAGGAGGQTGDAGPVDAGPAGCQYTGAPAEALVLTQTGPEQGVLENGIIHWLGVRFAAPPVGPLRWRPPEAPACFSTVHLASAPGPSCPQLDADGGYRGDEDCLTLDIWSGKGAVDAGVMVFIHGGGNTQGGSSDNGGLYSGQDLATRHGVVSIAINYRLGALGFFAHPQLNSESDAGVSGNYGILDQQAALRWVRANVSKFGGNPNQVMVFGESAGGQDTVIHLVSPGSRGLFKAAGIESGGAYNKTLSEVMTLLAPVAQAVNCSSDTDPIGCMRATSARTLASVPSAGGPLAQGMHYLPNIDGVVLPGYPPDLMRQGLHNHAAVIIGTNSDETSRMVPNVQTVAEYEAAVRAQYGTAGGNLVLAQYPASRFTTPRKALVAVTTDGTFTCGSRRIARALAAGQTEPVSRYYFSYQPPGASGGQIGATHGGELAFVFRTFAALGVATITPEAAALSDLMQSYWTRLAVTGNPNGPGTALWPAMTATGEDALELNASGAAVNPSVRAADCDFWDAH